MTTEVDLYSADATVERTINPQALTALYTATGRQSGELTLPPALPFHVQAPRWIGRAPATSAMPARARLSPMPAVSPWTPPPLQAVPLAGGAFPRPLAPIAMHAPAQAVPVPAAVPCAVPAALHIPANGTAAALGSANGGVAAPVFSPSLTPPFDRPHGIGMLPERLPDQASLRLFVGTWNMHGKAPPASLVPWLPASPDEHDMYVIGTQEAERSIEKSLIISSKAKWEAALRAHFSDSFVLLSVCCPTPAYISTALPVSRHAAHASTAPQHPSRAVHRGTHPPGPKTLAAP